MKRYEEKADADGVWTDEEHEEYGCRYDLHLDAEQLTSAEQADINAQGQTHQNVYDTIAQTADALGGTTDEAVDERRQNYETSNAGTMTWRNLTFTGQMVNQVGEDIYNQRERGIAAKNMWLTAQIYMNEEGHSEEELGYAQDILDFNYGEMRAAADAISKDMAVILFGSTCDVGLLGLGRPIAFFGGKVGGWIGGFFGKGPKVNPGGAGGARGAGTAAGATGAGSAAGAEARAAQQAANQVASDAAADAAIAGKTYPTPQQFQNQVGNTILLEEGAALGAGEGAALSQAMQEAVEQAAKIPFAGF